MDVTKIKAVIFDLDGTLIDTEKIYRMFWPKAVAEMGYEMTDEQYLSIRSLGRPFAPKQLKQWYGNDFDYAKARDIRTGYFNKYIEEHGIEKKPGAVELLTYLREHGFVTAIATATATPRAKKYLEQTELLGYFDKIISAAMVDEGKPSSKVYEYAVNQLGFLPEECIAVEDAPNGIISASDAKLNVIMVPDLTGPTPELEDRISAVANTLSDIIPIFEGNL